MVAAASSGRIGGHSDRLRLFARSKSPCPRTNPALEPLSECERDVFQLLALGYTTAREGERPAADGCPAG